jgi:hypothetical protein
LLFGKEGVMKRSLLAGVVALALLVTVVPSAVATTTWTARLGSYGVATVRVGSPDRLSINVKHFRARVTYPISLRRGSCARLGTLVWSTRLTSSSTGTMVRTFYLTRTQTSAAKLPLAIRVGTKCGAFTAPAPTPTPSPTPQPSPSPTPSATPSSGSTLVVGNGFMLALPDGWTYVPGSDLTSQVFRGPGSGLIGMTSLPTDLNLDGVTALIIAEFREHQGVDPEQTEAITIDGVPGRLLTYHYVYNGLNLHELDAFTVNNGWAFEVAFVSPAGTESADRTLLLGVIASFKFMSTPF